MLVRHDCLHLILTMDLDKQNEQDNQADNHPTSLDFNLTAQPVSNPSPVQDVISVLQKHLADETEVKSNSAADSGDSIKNVPSSGLTSDEQSALLTTTTGMDSQLTYVMVDQHGSPDWSKVLNFDKNIVAQVLKKHGINMKDLITGKAEQKRHKKPKKKKKAKSKKKIKDKVEKCSDQEDKQFKCTQCDKKYHLNKQLRDHMRYHDARKYPCKFCKYIAIRPRELEYHLNCHTGNRPFICTICKQGFGHPTVLATHKKTHRGHEGWVSCQICKMEFTRPHLLDRHMQTHNEERPHKCSFCTSDFKRPMDLRKHIRLYHSEADQPGEPKPEGNFKCNTCDRSFQAKLGLEQHQRRMHYSRIKIGLEDDMWPGVKHWCTVCSKEFGSLKLFTKHKISHSNLRPYTCSICGRSFKRTWELHKHKQVHSKQPSLPCTQCNSEFSGRIALRRHMINAHSSKVKKPVLKPFKCDICQKLFARKPDINDHMNIHTGNRPYVCDSCGKTFSFRSSLACHRKLHGEEAGAVICDICGRPFGSNIRMREHRVVHTGEKPFVCQHCGTRYKYPSNLRWHLNKAHKKGRCGGTRPPRQPKSTRPQAIVLEQDAPQQTEPILTSLQLAEVQFTSEESNQENLETQEITQPFMQIEYNTGEVHELAQFGDTGQLPPNVQVQTKAVEQPQDIMAVAEYVLETPGGGSRVFHTGVIIEDAPSLRDCIRYEELKNNLRERSLIEQGE